MYDEFDSFNIHLLKVESFSVLIENPVLRGGSMSMICDIATGLEANPGPIFNFHKCDVETWGLQCTNTENELYSEVGDILCPTVKLQK